jgi:predicted DNA-binding mobile mystery protein A
MPDEQSPTVPDAESLDEALGYFRESMRSLKPSAGWVRTIRESLGMSAEQLARRIGVSRATIVTLERSEARGRITLASLEKLSRGLGCRVVYALVPEMGASLADMKRARARKVARGQLASREADRSELERLTDQLLAGSPRKLWR